MDPTTDDNGLWVAFASVLTWTIALNNSRLRWQSRAHGLPRPGW